MEIETALSMALLSFVLRHLSFLFWPLKLRLRHINNSNNIPDKITNIQNLKGTPGPSYSYRKVLYSNMLQHNFSAGTILLSSPLGENNNLKCISLINYRRGLQIIAITANKKREPGWLP